MRAVYVVEIVNHFVKKRCDYVLDRSCKHSGTDVDFVRDACFASDVCFARELLEHITSLRPQGSYITMSIAKISSWCNHDFIKQTEKEITLFRLLTDLLSLSVVIRVWA